MDQWHFVRDGRRQGPYTWAQLRILAASGMLHESDMLVAHGSQQPIAARDCADLFAADSGSGSMPTATVMQAKCPKCGHAIAVPDPVPEKVACPSCRTTFRLRPPQSTKSGLAPASAPAPAPARIVRTVLEPAAGGTNLLRSQNEPLPIAVVDNIPANPPRTVLASSARNDAPEPARGTFGWRSLVAVAGVSVLATLAASAFLRPGADPAKSDEPAKANAPAKAAKAPESKLPPTVLVLEDFREMYEKNLPVPAGWVPSDSFIAVKEQDTYGMETTQVAGSYPAKIVLPSKLKGNFLITGAYSIPPFPLFPPHTMTFVLENRPLGVAFPISFASNGHIMIGKTPRVPPGKFVPQPVTKFAIKREGSLLKMFLDDALIANQLVDENAEYETLQIVMVAGNWGPSRRDRLIALKVENLP
jgi:ribosomal protein S27E